MPLTPKSKRRQPRGIPDQGKHGAIRFLTFHRPHRPLDTLCLSEIAHRVARWPFNILYPLLEAAREA